MRPLLSTALLALLLAPSATIAGEDATAGQMSVLTADQVGQIFCLSRLGNDDAVIGGILTAQLGQALTAAGDQNDAWMRLHPDEKPPLGDGIPWQSAADYADACDIGLVTLSGSDARVEIRYAYSDTPDAAYVDTLILKKVPIEGMDVGRWHIDDVLYADGTDLKGTLASAFEAD